MYKFIDVTEASAGIPLPSEAFQLNGEYLENQINGYRTLHVSGREALSPELTSYEVGVRDGSKLQSKRFPARVLTVTYQLSAKTNEAFREAYNQLGSILNVEEAELIFNDEADKFFIGTCSLIESVEAGRNSVIGTFEILCTDPFKYSVVEYEVEQSLEDNSILLDYKGTYQAFPILEASFYKESDVLEDGETTEALTGKGDCGYVAFFNEREKIIQLGDPDEKDGSHAFEKSQTLMNQTFQSSTAWGAGAKGLWTANNGGVLPSDIQQSGTVGMAIASYAVPSNPAETSGTLIDVWSDSDEPKFNYKVVAKTSARNASSVRVTMTITTTLKYNGSYFGKSFSLVGSVYMGGSWHNVTLKEKGSYWRGRTAHTANLSITVSGLSSDTAVLNGIKFKVTRGDSVGGGAGILSEKSCNNLSISTYTANVPETYYLSATSYGTASGKWHGASITRTLSADSSGEVGAKDFTLTYQQKMCIDKVNQLGAFQVQVTTATGANIAGFRIYKNSTGNNGTLVLYQNGKSVYTRSIGLSYDNYQLGAGANAVKTSSIIKNGESIRFSIGGFEMILTDASLKDIKAEKVTFLFEQYSTSPPLAYNGIYSVKFIKNNCDTWKDIPNKFSTHDVIKADCKDGKIYLNGVHAPEYGALGNDWEEFYLEHGLNQIGISYSEWVEKAYAPKFKIRYREVFL